jgi:hypothetical protein
MSVKWSGEAEPKWKSAMVLKNVSDFVVDSFSGRQGLNNGSDAAIVLDGATDGVIRNSKATEGTNTFVYVKGDPKNYVSFKDNETRKAKRAMSYEKEIKK